MAYTVHDTPAILARIEADLAAAVAVVREGDPHVRSIVLTGGFSRGEGAVVDGAPQNDYDLVAFRGLGRPRVGYPELRRRLGDALGLHVDLAPVARARLPWLPSTIFWYETAVRGRTLWGEDLLRHIGVRSPAGLDAAEGVRLLANRAAGLLLAPPEAPAGARRLQAAKAILGAADARLLAAGRFAPSQRERWGLLQSMGWRRLDWAGRGPAGSWLDWAFHFKLEPARASAVDPGEAWSAARQAVLGAVPAAIAHAGLSSLAEYARRDGWVDRLFFLRRSAEVPGAHRFARHPTGRVRVAGLRLLEASPDGRVPPEAARRALAPLAEPGPDPLRVLEALRVATRP